MPARRLTEVAPASPLEGSYPGGLAATAKGRATWVKRPPGQPPAEDFERGVPWLISPSVQRSSRLASQPGGRLTARPCS